MKKNEIFKNPYAVFDFDGTLVDSNEAFIEILSDFFTSNFSRLRPELIEEAKTMDMEQTCRAVKKWTGTFASVEEIANILESRAADFYNNKVELKPGAKAFVQALIALGARLCIASATDEDTIQGVLRRLGMDSCFEFIVTVPQVGAAKDKPDIFLEAARRFGNPNHSEITVYDDSLEALKSAMSVGMRTVCVYDAAGDTTGARQFCDAYIDSFEEITYR